MTYPRMSKERLEEIRDRVRRQTAYECERELLVELDAVKAQYSEMLEVNTNAHHLNTKLAIERDSLKEELAIARERLGPAGYKIIQEVAVLREKLKIMQIAIDYSKQEKADFGDINNDR